MITGSTVHFQLPGGYIAKPFRTNHRVPSQGYLLYKQSKQLKAEFVGMPSSEINALHKKGVAVHDVLLTPEVAYTGEWVRRVRVVLHVNELLQCVHIGSHSSITQRIFWNFYTHPPPPCCNSNNFEPYVYFHKGLFFLNI